MCTLTNMMCRCLDCQQCYFASIVFMSTDRCAPVHVTAIPTNPKVFFCLENRRDKHTHTHIHTHTHTHKKKKRKPNPESPNPHPKSRTTNMNRSIRPRQSIRRCWRSQKIRRCCARLEGSGKAFDFMNYCIESELVELSND